MLPRRRADPQGTVRGAGVGASSRGWVLEVGLAQPGLPPALLEKQKGDIMGGGVCVCQFFLMKKSLFALVEKPISCPSKTLSAGWWCRPRGALQSPLRGMG